MKTLFRHGLMALALLALTILNSTLSTARAQGTAFTYQGRLNSGGSPANGLYDFRFRLDGDPAGNTILATLLTNSIPVTNGLFMTTIDFGGGFFNGSNYWLEVDVKTNSFATYTVLNPLQQITPAPYAVFASTASNLSGTLPAAQLNGAVPSANFSGTYGNVLALNNAGNSFNGSYAGNGASVSNVNAMALNGLNATNFWQLGGNNVAPGQFLGSMNNQPVELWANASRAFRLEPNPGGTANVIGGFSANYVAGGVNSATIAGGGANGFTNRVTGNGGFVGSGFNNAVSNLNGVVVGGANNTAGGNASGIGSGSENDAEGDHAGIAGGQGNVIQADADHSVIGGGGNNLIVGSATLPVYSTIGGGQFNTIATNSNYSTIGGGINNTNIGEQAVIGGGANNTAAAPGAFIGGGVLNTVTGNGFYSTLGGGLQNTNNANTGTIGGGLNNQVSGIYSTIGGGNANSVSGPLGFVGGGYNNQASGIYATVPGGIQNNAGGSASFAAGSHAQATNQGAFVWADSQGSPFASTANNQFLIRAQGGVGINMNNNPDNLQTASLYAQGANSNGWPNSVVWFQNTASATNNAPALRVVNTSANATNTDGALSVSIQGQGLIAEFGNSGAFVVTITNDGTVYATAFVGTGSGLANLNASQLTSIGNTNGGSANFFAGPAGNSTMSGGGNTANGSSALHYNTSGSGNTAVGTTALFDNTSGNNNTAYGNDALWLNVSGSGNTAVGKNALEYLGDLASGGTNNIALGYGAGSAYTAIESSNINIGNFGVAGENNTIRIGSGQTQTYIVGVINGNGGGLTNLNAAQLTGALPAISGANLTSLDPSQLTTIGNGNFFVGPSGNSTTIGSDNTASGFQALLSNTSGDGNTAAGSFALLSNTNGSVNTAIGDHALNDNASGSLNTASGALALYRLGFSTHAGGTNNIALGYLASYNFTGNESSNIDIGSLGVSGENNIIRIGSGQTQTYIAGVINGNGGGLTSLNAAQVTGSFTNGFIINGSQSGGIGSPLALIQNNNTSGNTAPALRTVGYGNSPNGVLSVSSQGTGLLAQFGNALAFVADITTNGTVEAASFTGGSANVATLTGGTVSVTNLLRLDDKPVYFRPGGDVNHGLAYSGTTVTNFGTGNVQVDGPVLWGFSGGALAVMNGGAHAVLTWTNGGVSVTGGFAFSSDRNMKTGFAALDAQDVLARVAALPLTSWYYKTDTGARHFGPMAQDFHEAFALGGGDDKHINVGDEGGVALAAIQGLNQKLETEVKQKDERIGELEKRLNDLEQLVQAIAAKK